MPCPTYPEIRLALFAGRAVARRLDALAADRRAHRDRRAARAGGTALVPADRPRVHHRVSHAVSRIRPRARPDTAVGRATRSCAGSTARPSARWWRRRRCSGSSRRDGFDNIARWSRGVDSELFRPRDKATSWQLPRPIWLYLGRVAVEKGIEDFLQLDLPGTKLVIGDGPGTGRRCEREYPGGASSSATSTARTWRDTSPRATCSYSRAAPTRSGWCCSKRWPAACRSPPIRSPARSTSSVDGVTGVLDEDLRTGRPAGAGTRARATAASTRWAIRGSPAQDSSSTPWPSLASTT